MSGAGTGVPTAARRVERELRRLEALAARRRTHLRSIRGMRAALGGGGTLAALIKLKLAGSLALKLGLAGLVALGFAWPLFALGAIMALYLLLLIVSLFDGSVKVPSHSGSDLDWLAWRTRRQRRSAHLAGLIERRRAWLDAPDGPAPSPADEAAENRASRHGRPISGAPGSRQNLPIGSET